MAAKCHSVFSCFEKELKAKLQDNKPFLVWQQQPASLPYIGFLHFLQGFEHCHID